MPLKGNKDQTAGEGFVIGPNDRTYSVSDIPDMKARIALNPAFAGMLQPLIDRLEAGDFDQPWIGDDGEPIVTTDTGTTLPGATNQEDISAAVAAAMQEAGLLTAADAEELFKNSLPIDYETLQKMGEQDWTSEGIQTMIDNAIAKTQSQQNQNYVDQATLDEQLAGLPDAAQIQKLLEEQGWGSIGDPFGGLSGITPEQWDELLGGNYATTNAVQQMIAESLANGLSAEDIFTLVQ